MRTTITLAALAFLLASAVFVAAAPQPGEVVIAPKGGIFSNFVVVALSSSNALVRYTLDGSEPTEKSVGYSIPFILDKTATVSARTFPRDQAPGRTITQSYSITSQPVANFTSDLPVMVIDTLGQALDVPRSGTGSNRVSSRPKLAATVTLYATNQGRVSLAGPVAHRSWAEVNVRGGSTSMLWKKPLKLELQDDEGNDLKADLLGLPKESDWILLACFRDRTFVRDVLTYELCRQMGYFAPRWRYVELFIRTNGTPDQSGLAAASGRLRQSLANGLPTSGDPPEWGDYAGLYILVEKIKRGKHRLDIEKIRPQDAQPPEVTGGYIFRRDRLNPGEQGFRSPAGIHFAYEEPKEREITPAQRDYLTNYVNDFERSLFDGNFSDPTNGYAKFIEVDSFVDYHWMIETAKDMDGYTFSQFLHKDRGAKLRMGPMWDMDMAYGASFFMKGYRTNDWRWVQVPAEHYKWYARLFEDPDFLQRYIDRWSELRRTVFATTNVLALVDQLAAPLLEAQVLNFKRWPVFGEPSILDADRGQSYRNEVNWLKRWISSRLAWIDGQDFPPPKVQIIQDPLSAARNLIMASQVGKIHFTTDGTDPRLPGGAVSSAAKPYSDPISLETNTVVTASVRSDYGLWSAPVKVKGTERAK